jgi:hypothetical protein
VMERRGWAGWIGCHEVKSQRVNYKKYSGEHPSSVVLPMSLSPVNDCLDRSEDGQDERHTSPDWRN